MKPDPRLEAHLINCEKVAQELQRSGQWPWGHKKITEDEYVLNQDTVDGVAELIAVLQSIRRDANQSPSIKPDHENEDQPENRQSKSHHNRH